MPSKTLD